MSINGDNGSTDARGALFTDLDAGNYTLALSFQGNEITEVEFVVADADSEELEIEVSYARDDAEPRPVSRLSRSGTVAVRRSAFGHRHRLRR